MATLVTWDEFTSGGRPQGGTIRELVLEKIVNVVSKRRPLLSLIDSIDVTNTFVEILSDTYATRAANAMPEGIAYTAQSVTQPTRTFRHVQSFYKSGQISDEQSMVGHYAQRDPFTYQGQKSMTELLNDIEHALHRGSAATGATNAARQFDGLLNISNSNTVTSSSGTTYTEQVLVDHLQVFRDNSLDIWPTVAFVGALLKRTISEFSTRTTRYVDAADKAQYLIVERHHSDFGDLDVIYSEDQLQAANSTSQGNSVVYLDPSYFHTGWLRRPMVERLSRDGLRNRFQINAQCSLIYDTVNAMGAGTGYVSYLNQS